MQRFYTFKVSFSCRTFALGLIEALLLQTTPELVNWTNGKEYSSDKIKMQWPIHTNFRN